MHEPRRMIDPVNHELALNCNTMEYQLVLEFPGESLRDLDAAIELEDELVEQLRDLANVDGLDAGSGETNIIISTSDPTATFGLAKSVLERRQRLQKVRASYREAKGRLFTAIWPVAPDGNLKAE